MLTNSPDASPERGLSLDWPLSTNEKKSRVMCLYDKENRVANALVESGEIALEALRNELQAVRNSKAEALISPCKINLAQTKLDEPNGSNHVCFAKVDKVQIVEESYIVEDEVVEPEPPPDTAPVQSSRHQTTRHSEQQEQLHLQQQRREPQQHFRPGPLQPCQGACSGRRRARTGLAAHRYAAPKQDSASVSTFEVVDSMRESAARLQDAQQELANLVEPPRRWKRDRTYCIPYCW